MKRIIATAALAVLLSSQAFAVDKLSPAEVNAAVEAGDMVLIDIRTPEEWATTGIAANAHALDMTTENFADQVNKLMKSNRGKKIAFICQSGVRSKRLADELEGAGLSGIVDVVGGTKAWIADGLPISQP
jgi:rhodanese-related sulfurtransferase